MLCLVFKILDDFNRSPSLFRHCVFFKFNRYYIALPVLSDKKSGANVREGVKPMAFGNKIARQEESLRPQ